MRRRLWVPVVAAAVAALLLGLPSLLNFGGDPDVGSDGPDSNSGWYWVADPDLDVGLHDLIEFNDLFVAVGSRIVVSEDGVVWSAVLPSADAPDPIPTLDFVFEGSSGLVAGYNGELSVWLWTSDDGRSWTRLEQNVPDAEFLDVVVGGPGFVAVGRAIAVDGATLAGASVAAVWTSVDGVQWTRVPHDPDVFGDGGSRTDMTGVASGNGVLVAVGNEGWDGADTRVVWTSIDGVNWSRSGLGTLTLTDHRTDRDVIFFSSRFVTAFGWSEDGRSWTPAEKALDSATIFEVLDDRLIAVRPDGWRGPVPISASMDGIRWTAFGRVRSHIRQFIAAGPGLIGVGSNGIGLWFTNPDHVAEYGELLWQDTDLEEDYSTEPGAISPEVDLPPVAGNRSDEASSSRPDSDLNILRIALAGVVLVTGITISARRRSRSD